VFRTDLLSVHHQESQQCIHNNRYLSYWLCWLSTSVVRMEQIPIAVYTVLRLLMMDSRSVRNIVEFFIKINLRNCAPRWFCYTNTSRCTVLWMSILLVQWIYIRVLKSPVLWPASTGTLHCTTQQTSTGLSYALNFQAGITSQIPSCASRLPKESPARAKDEEYVCSKTLCNHQWYLRTAFPFCAMLLARHQRVDVTESCLTLRLPD